MDFEKLARTARAEFIDKARALLCIPTVLEHFDESNVEEPFGEAIRKALDLMLEFGMRDGFEVKNIANFAGHIEMGQGEEILGILGHLDVVPAGGKWTDDPFSATLRDGRIYARGAMDDKGPTIAAYLAMKIIKDLGVPLRKRVRLILGCDEESGMRCIKKYLEHEAMPDLGFAPDADFPLIYGEKGIFSFDIVGEFADDLVLSLKAGDRYNVVPDRCDAHLAKDLAEPFREFLHKHAYQGEVVGNRYTIYGRSAHAAWPHLGVNAIFLMMDFLKEHTQSPIVAFIEKYLLHDHLGRKLGIDHHDEEMKDLTINTAKVDYLEHKFRIGCNIRYPKGYDFAKGCAAIRAAAASFSLEFIELGNSPYHYVSPKDPLVAELHKAYIKYTGDDKSPLITIGGGTYARKLKKAVAFGPNFPGREDLAHQPDEYLDIDEMLKAVAIYAESIISLAGPEAE